MSTGHISKDGRRESDFRQSSNKMQAAEEYRRGIGLTRNGPEHLIFGRSTADNASKRDDCIASERPKINLSITPGPEQVSVQLYVVIIPVLLSSLVCCVLRVRLLAVCTQYYSVSLLLFCITS